MKQAKIFQDRAEYIRQVWAAKRGPHKFSRQSLGKLYKPLRLLHFTPPTPQSNPAPPLTSLANKKRNQKTREHHKKKKAQAQCVTIQEVEHSYGQEMEHLDSVRSSGEAAAKCARSGAAFSARYVVLRSWDWVFRFELVNRYDRIVKDAITVTTIV